MKSSYFAAALIALGAAACTKEAPVPAPAPKAEAPKPGEAPAAAPADAGKPIEPPKVDENSSAKKPIKGV